MIHKFYQTVVVVECMDFSIKKPTHVLALVAVLSLFLIIIVLPVLSFFDFFPAIDEKIRTIPEEVQSVFEITVLGLQLVIIIGLFIGIPALWYILVQRLSIKHILERLQIKKQGLPSAAVWGFIAMICGFIIVLIIDFFLIAGGYDLTKQSNIEDLGKFLSAPSILLIITIQPIAEEVFFRGFLLEKLTSWKGPLPAICVTSLLFGIAHLSYGKVYPMIATAFVGAILAFFVIKTKNLFTGIFAHILFNLVSFSIYYSAQHFFS